MHTRAWTVIAAAAAGLALQVACSSDDATVNPVPTGGSAGTAGGAGAGGSGGTAGNAGAAGDAGDAGDELDSSVCGADEMLAYIHAGCGAEAEQECVTKYQDACIGYYCGCDGVTFSGGCQSATQPYAYSGACEGGDAAGE